MNTNEQNPKPTKDQMKKALAKIIQHQRSQNKNIDDDVTDVSLSQIEDEYSTDKSKLEEK